LKQPAERELGIAIQITSHDLVAEVDVGVKDASVDAVGGDPGYIPDSVPVSLA